MLKKLLLLLLVSVPVIADVVVIPDSCVSQKLGDKLFICFEDSQFFIVNKDQQTVTQVNKCWSDALIRKFETQEQLDAFFKHSGKIRVNQSSDGEYVLSAYIPLKGGGPILSGLFYGIAKTISYVGITLMVTGAVASVTVLAPAAMPITLAAGSIAKGALGVSACISAVGTGSAAAITMASPAIAAGIATTTAATLATAGGAAGFFAMIEMFAAGAAAFGMVLGPL